MAGARRRRIRGDRAFKKLIGRMPEAIRDGIVRMLEEMGRSILAAQRADAPSRTGAVRQALSMRVLRGALQLKVGLIGRPLNRRLFYARIVEGGRKAQRVWVTRLDRGARPQWLALIGAGQARARSKPRHLTRSYWMQVRAMAPRPFIYSARAEAGRLRAGGEIGKYWDNVLSTASQGATDD